MAFHLMIVDDSPAMRAFIVRVIGLSGLEVDSCVEAANGLPVMNGEQDLSAAWSRDEMLRTIPVLVVSTDGSEHRVQRMMSLGAKGYVKKPFSPEHLRTTMERLLGVSDD